MTDEAVCSHIMFCDHVIVEQGTGKNTLVGTFHNLASHQFPFQIPRMIVHVGLTNFVPTGKPFQFALNLKGSSGAVIGSFGHSIALPKPPQPLEASNVHVNLNVPLLNVVVPKPGNYDCEVLFDGEPIGKKTLQIQQAQRNPMTNPPQQLP